jgi:O-methyltransferase
MMASINELYPSATDKHQVLEELHRKVQHLEGDVAEFGVYHGENTRTLARLFPDRTVWAFDTFTGMPKEDYLNLNDEDRSDTPGKWAPEVPPSVLFAGYHNIHPIQGRFADTLQHVDPSVRFILCHVDCDWYTSHKQVLEFLTERLVPGAVLLF